MPRLLELNSSSSSVFLLLAALAARSIFEELKCPLTFRRVVDTFAKTHSALKREH